MKLSEIGQIDCSIAKTLSIVGEPWTLMILRSAFLRVRKFQDFEQTLGVSRALLSKRLDMLVEQDIMQRVQYQSNPPRYEYRLTEKGLDLYPIFIGLVQWGDKWMANECGPPVIREHIPCGHVLQAHLVCDKCGVAVQPQDINVRLNRKESA